jgi:ribonuclease R
MGDKWLVDREMTLRSDWLFLGRALRTDGGMTIERCLDPTRSNRVVLAGDDTLGEGDYVIAVLETEGARVVQRLADGGSMLARIYAIAVAHRLDPVFPAGVKEEVESLLQEPGIWEPGLSDLTSIPFCTIDGPDTRDLDQALHVLATDGGFQLSYALADASWFVTPGSALFGEAVHRASSFYLPGLVIPMLPRELSEGVCSLNPGGGSDGHS